MDPSASQTARFDEMRKMFTAEQLAMIFKDPSLFKAAFDGNTTITDSNAKKPGEPDTAPKSLEPAAIIVSSKSTSNAGEHDNNLRGSGSSSSRTSSSTTIDAPIYTPPSTPSPKKSNTFQKPQAKTRSDKVQKTPSPARRLSGMTLASPSSSPAAATKRKPTRTLKRVGPYLSGTPSQNTKISRINKQQTETRTPPKVDESNGDPKKFVIGLDFGTTFTSVSYYAHPVDEDHPRAFPNDIEVIKNWPTDGMGGARCQLPTEYWYSAVPKDRPMVKNQFELAKLTDNYIDLDDLSDTDDTASPTPLQSHNEDQAMDDENSSKDLWGYQAPYQRFLANSTRDESRHISRPKLMLVDSKHTREDRARLRPRLKSLIEKGIIRKFTHREKEHPRDVQDVVSDFLTEILAHTKAQLMDHANYTKDCIVSFVLTVPVIWAAESSRVLQFSLEAAIKASGFGGLDHGSINDLFIITEPEAAATYLLGNSHDMLAGETFIILDCGGGTVDCVTYTVASEYPLRLQREVGPPSGDNCGASYLNDNFEKHLLKRLADETYLERDGETLRSLVRHLVPHFENYDKRFKDITKRPSSRIKILGLRSSEAKRFEKNALCWSPEDYNDIFLPLLRRVGHVLWGQIDMAVSKGRDVKKVFLIGGFGACPSLRSYLSDFLQDATKEFMSENDISLVTTTDQRSVTAVSSGAVLRALDKQGGPERVARSSYGFLRVQKYDPFCQGHKGAEITTDPFDGEDYVRVIQYFMLKDEVVPPVFHFKPMKSTHAFGMDEKIICEEVLYVSDLPLTYDSGGRPEKSDFAVNHHHNRDAREAGTILTDFTFLRDEGKIRRVSTQDKGDGEFGGQDYDEITYDLVPVVEGRNLRYEARFPSGPGGRAQKTGQVSIAAAFEPGTG